ncbi:U-box domain-containing protein kinase family protein [Quillaja saponaria]|uniref:RING-type E3 ubiquitin transferase n=1 Tax=Quillaja saponaria TaxID=32244 RepID=A0AAD7PC56_QUISA|nr:U-box domain-containing protein kinase family protein [Quillaja saponaria]
METSQNNSSPVVAVAIKGNRKSKYVVMWALNKFVPEGRIIFKLIHVRAGITGVPTPMGNIIPFSQVRDDVAAAFKKEVEWQTSEMLLPYKKMCTNRKVQVDVVVIESDDVAIAIAKEVAKAPITTLVIGASSRGIFRRKLKGLSARISVCTPRFCTIYAVSKGKLSSLRPSDIQIDGSNKADCSETSFSSNNSSNYTSSSRTDLGSVASISLSHSPSLPMQRFQALSTLNQTFINTNNTNASTIEVKHSRCQSLDIGKEINVSSSSPSNSDTAVTLSRASSCRSMPTDDQSWISDQTSITDVLTECPSSDSQANINFELEKLRIELRHVRGMHALAQSENIDASRKLNNLGTRRMEEAMKLKDITAKEEMAKELARQEKDKYEAAKREAAYVTECAEREAADRRDAEMKAVRTVKEKEKLEDALVGSMHQYHKFTWEEIVSATSSFSEDLRIGMGAYGIVYKCSLHHTTVAVKVLHSKETQESKQFRQELEILSRTRHPNLLLLFGACPDRGCLVYEYMENGSLEDRLFRKNNTPPVPWFERYRISWEVASALAFLHNTKPKPIIHRDLKPANILLDRNFKSKIGDVGLSTVLHSDTSLSAIYNDTGPVGTLCYIDPEYQRTGLISPMSDVYAYGMVILQLLTAKPPKALTHVVETAINDGHLVDILDPEAGNWPFQETLELARLGLSCAELRRRDRPDLKDQVLPALERLKEVADRARDSAYSVKSRPPNHFMCPILKDVMSDPCVASDGYTYDHKAIEKWLQENDKSPMTNMTLPNKNLIPNYTLLSAILEWKAREI